MTPPPAPATLRTRQRPFRCSRRCPSSSRVCPPQGHKARGGGAARGRPTRSRSRSSARSLIGREAAAHDRQPPTRSRRSGSPTSCPWFAPGLRVALLPDWETLPYDPFSPHQDLVSERLATLYRVSRGECDVLVVAATTALYRLAPPVVSRGVHVLPEAGHASRRRRRCARSSRSPATSTSRRSSRPASSAVRGGLIDLFPMGSPLPYPARSLRRRHREHQDVRRRHAAHALPGARRAPPARRASFRSTRRAARASAARYREVFEGDPSRSPLYKDVSNGVRAGRHRVLPAAVLRSDGDARRLSAARRRRRVRRRCRQRRRSASGRTPTRATSCCAATRRGRCCRRSTVFLPPDAFNGALKPHARVEIAAARSNRIAGRRRRAPQPLPSRPGRPPRRRSARGARSATSRRRPTRASLICAESAGRRETMQQYFAEYGLRAAARRRLASRRYRARRFVALGRLAAARGLRVAEGEARVRHRSGALRRRRAPRHARCRAPLERRRDAARPLRGAHRRPGRPRAARHRPLPGPRHDGSRRRRRPNSCSSSTPTTRSSTSRSRTCISSDATAAHRPKRRRCTSSAAASGRRRRSAPRGRRTTPPPSF